MIYQPFLAGVFPFALDSSAHTSNLTGPTSTLRIGTVLPPIEIFFSPCWGCCDAGIHGPVVSYSQHDTITLRTFPGRVCSFRISIVSVNVQSSGKGDRLASEYAVRIIAARNESSRACFCITAFTILRKRQIFQLSVRTENQCLQAELQVDYSHPK